MNSVQTFVRALPVLALLVSATTLAAPVVVEISADASRPAANDMITATVSAEAAAPSPAESSRQVNASIADALRAAKAYSGVKAQSGGTSTYPIYSKAGKIESWRMRSDLVLESRNLAELSELLGKLQASLAVSSLAMHPSPETRKKAENEALVDAIAAFRQRAGIVAETLGKPFTIRELSVNTGGRTMPPTLRAAGKAMAAEAAPMPMEAGESLVSATVSGKIELE